jgi:DNA polymerase-3 subunit gamma/tau
VAESTHLAIARKWRPQRFEDISGQGHVTRTLQNALRLGRIHHAFLLTGARGVGKTSAARILARALNCERGPGAENPCNECSACREMLAGTFPDLVEIDAASHNSVDDVRDLVDKVRYAPQRGKYKVYVIDEVHMVTKQGFNALLKTLEEPPPHVVFILATTDPQQLLETVTSRCQRHDFKMIPVRVIYERLKEVVQQEGVQVPDSSLMVIAREGGGSMRDAQSLLDQVLSFASGAVTEQEVAEILGFIDRSILYEVLEGALRGEPAAALLATSKVATFGYDVRTFANQLLEGVRNVSVLVHAPQAERILDLPDEELQRLRVLAKGRDAIPLQQQFDILASAVDGIVRSEQPMLLLEMAVVKMASVRPFVPVERLVDRLEALERRLQRGGVAAPTGPRTVSPAYAASAPTAPPASPAPAPAPGIPRPTSAASAIAGLVGSRAATPPTPAAPTPAAPTAPPATASLAAALPSTSPGASPAPLANGPAPAVSATPPSPTTPDPLRPDPPGADWCDGPRWRRFVHSLRREDGLGPAQALLARATFVGAATAGAVATVQLGYRSEITARQAERFARDAAVLALARDWFGRDVGLEPRLDPEGRGGRSLAEELERLAQQRSQDAERSARSHPVIARAREAFPGLALDAVQLPELGGVDDVQ